MFCEFASRHKIVVKSENCRKIVLRWNVNLGPDTDTGPKWIGLNGGLHSPRVAYVFLYSLFRCLVKTKMKCDATTDVNCTELPTAGAPASRMGIAALGRPVMSNRAECRLPFN